MPPLLAAAEMLASPVANITIPKASALPVLGLVVAGPAETGPFMLKVTGANTGPLPTAQPVINAAQDNASTRLFTIDFSPSDAVGLWSQIVQAGRVAVHQVITYRDHSAMLIIGRYHAGMTVWWTHGTPAAPVHRAHRPHVVCGRNAGHARARCAGGSGGPARVGQRVTPSRRPGEAALRGARPCR